MRTKEKDKLEKRQKVIEHLEKDVEELRRLSGDGEADSELERIRQQVAELRREFYIHLGPWQRAQIARHQQRTYTLDYVNYLFTDFVELHGDRGFVDTQVAYPGIDAEERGQGEAIARNLREMARLPVPIIVTVTGEGGSGGALAIAVGDKVNILENSFYSVISPEGCASIIWRDATKAETAAAAMKITAKDLKDLGIVDEIIPEPDGGAHTDHEGAARLLDDVLDRQLVALTNEPVRELLAARYEKFRKMGQFFDLSNG